jgi:hypothetical protein
MSKFKNAFHDEIQESYYADLGGVFEPINTNAKGVSQSERETTLKAAREYIKTASFAKEWDNAFYQPEMRWKQTSMPVDWCVEKYGKENVKHAEKFNMAGDPITEVYVELYGDYKNGKN